jgi:ATP-dependent DNA helicase RecG
LRIVHTVEDLAQPIERIKGMRQSTVDALGRLGISTIRDLLYFFPRTHYDYTDTRSISRLRMGQKTTLVGTIVEVRHNRTARGVNITTAVISDDSGTIAVRWFNQPYMAKQLPRGARVAITGEPDVFNERWTFTPRDWEIIKSDELTHGARLAPIYPLTRGLFQRSLRGLMKRVVEEYAAALEDFLPVDLQEELRFPTLPEAIASYHFPVDEEQKSWAEQRLAFDELFLIQIGLLLRKRQLQQPVEGVAIPIEDALLERFCTSLPFALTGAQRRVMLEILDDMARPVPMNRLLQGDVGSGKTVVAAAALAQVMQAGKQGLLMAPTEILAEQHFATLQTLLEPLGICCELLIGSTTKAKRRKLLEGVKDGSVQVLVGTHALIQEGVELDEVGLAITDEQHRFGVEQRALLRQKGLSPHVLAMTATPIPRTLAMTLYGDLDLSSIDEMPPGRLPVVTTWAKRASEAYGVVRDEVRKGRQAFIICPVIEESAERDMRSVIAEHKELQSVVFRDLQVGLLHGRMKASEKDAVLSAFRRGEYHVLVATSVVEVGIDIPNATVMVIRDAHRFGLAQLHQFRGRVGRGGDQAFCVLLSDSEGENASERLEALTALDSGFDLAEEDLRLRGPGEFWGTRQSGLPELRVAQLGDVATIELARDAATELLKRDPELSSPEDAVLRAEVERFWAQAPDIS